MSVAKAVPIFRLIRITAALVLLLGLVAVAGTAPARADQNGEGDNMTLVGQEGLQGRSAYQPIIHEQDGRFIAYVGHHAGEAANPLTGTVEPNGVSIVDVTDPRKPQYLHHLPPRDGEEQAQMVQWCPGSELPAGEPGAYYLLRSNGTVGHDVYDVTDPANPALAAEVVTGLVDTHKSWWECSTGIAYLVSGVPGWASDRMLQIFDLSDPANPVHIRDFHVPGTQPGAAPPARVPRLHEPLYHDGKVYMGYGTGADGTFQILDNDELLNGDFDPRNPTDAELLAPQIARLDFPDYHGVHSAVPYLGMDVPEFADFAEGTPRDMALLVGESTTDDCGEPMHLMVFMTDITDPAHPIPVDTYYVPESEGDFCERGGRFGAHATNWNFTQENYHNRIAWISYFNAGVRGVDIRDPFNMTEVAHYIPAVTENTMETGGATVIQTNNVEVDDDGFVYTVDRAGTGMHILFPTGEAREIAFPDLAKGAFPR